VFFMDRQLIVRAVGDTGHQPGHQGGAARQRGDLDVLVQGVSAVTDRAQPVQRRHAEGGGEVAVRATARTPFGQIEAEVARRRACLIIETRHPGGAFQRRPIEPAAGVDPGPRIDRGQCGHRRADLIPRR
jgi:hypothetical protein